MVDNNNLNRNITHERNFDEEIEDVNGNNRNTENDGGNTI